MTLTELVEQLKGAYDPDEEVLEAFIVFDEADEYSFTTEEDAED